MCIRDRSSSETDEQGLATVSFTPAAIGELRLKATVFSGSAVTLAVKVRDPLENPDHATIKSISASPNPAFTNDYIIMTAVIVSTASGEPLPNREVFTSLNGQPYQPNKTDARGEIKAYWRPIFVESVSLYVEVRNTGEAPKRDGVVVIVNS